MLTVAILAGGLATRLHPLTLKLPKALIEIDGEPFIAHQLELLRSRGVNGVVICSGYLADQLEAYVGDGSRFGVHVAYSYDGQSLLGTAGALKKARSHLGDAFFVLYGDSYLTCEYMAIQSVHESSGRLGLMTIHRNDGQWDRSNVQFEDGRILAYDKRASNACMRHIDYGLGVLDARALDFVPEDRPYDLAELYRDLLAQHQLAAYEVPERFFEVGSPAGIADLRRFLANGPGGSAGAERSV